jgi:hypothetical protein
MLREAIRKLSRDEKIFPIEGDKDDIFVACASLEDRTTAVAKRFSKKHKIQHSLVFKYEEKDKTNLREQNFQMLKKTLEIVSDNVFPILCDHHDVIDGISKFFKTCKDHGISMKDSNVTMDITTFTKQFLLVLLKIVEKEAPKNLRLFYTEPKDYASRWGEPLSYGIIDIVSVPSYGGYYELEKESLLILLLGYEGDRAFATWQQFAPNKTIALVGRPSFRSSWEGRVEKFNASLLAKLPSEDKSYIPTLDPFEVSHKLDRLIDEHKTKYNVSISPLGPKPQVVGCYLALRKHPEVQVLYAIPKFHNPKYTKQVGKIWEYR